MINFFPEFPLVEHMQDQLMLTVTFTLPPTQNPSTNICYEYAV